MNAETELNRLLNTMLKSELKMFRNKTFAIGGFVRDKMMNIESNDLDVVVELDGGSKSFTSAIHSFLSDETTKPFQLGNFPIWKIEFIKNVEWDGGSFQTKGAELEVADTQSEMFPDVNSRQRISIFGTIEEDILRRDFVMNQFRLDLTSSEIIEPFPGALGIFQSSIIQTHPKVDANEILAQDPLRMIRALRFSVQLGWKIDEKLLDIIIQNKDRIKILSSERIVKELKKVCNVQQGLFKFIKLLDKCQLLEIIFPEIAAQKNVKQGKDIREIHLESSNVFGHTLEVLSHCEIGFLNGMIALFHDIGKTNECLEMKKGMKDDDNLNGHRFTFIGHDKLGAELIVPILKQLKLSSSEINVIQLIIKHHLKLIMLENNGVKSKSIRKLWRQLSESKQNLQLLFNITKADSFGTLKMREDGIKVPAFNIGHKLKPIIEQVIDEVPIRKSDLLNGKEIMDLLNVKPSPIIAKVKQFIVELEDEFGTQLTKQIAKEKILSQFDSNSIK